LIFSFLSSSRTGFSFFLDEERNKEIKKNDASTRIAHAPLAINFHCSKTFSNIVLGLLGEAADIALGMV
jgi:hypothetical protein